MKDIFEDIYDKYHHDLYKFVFYMVKDKYVTEDLIQDIYIKVLNSYHKFRGESNEKTWLFSIARHTTIDYFRRQKRKRSRLQEFFDWNEKGSWLPDPKPLPEEVAERNDDIKNVFRFLDHCSPDQKSVLILRYIQSFSIKETAEILRFTESKVKTTQHRGLKILQDAFSSYEEKGGDV
ncbi:RNA polymerase sigma factor SigX [Virgibacillus flavescens]|uniref:RNA polymerase sigma factor SigX n=1 Tax=Virgibacillus flavescens TaxID=1611422 RepID=UPI003D345F15